MRPRFIWIMIDGNGEFYGPFESLFTAAKFSKVAEPVTMVQVENGADLSVFLAAGDALAATMTAMIYTKRIEKRAAFNKKVNWQ